MFRKNSALNWLWFWFVLNIAVCFYLIWGSGDIENQTKVAMGAQFWVGFIIIFVSWVITKVHCSLQKRNNKVVQDVEVKQS